MKFVAVVFVIALTWCPIIDALMCTECSGSETSDCAKGVKGAGVAVKCESPNFDAPIPLTHAAQRPEDETSTEPDISSTPTSVVDSNYERLKKLGCYEPVKLYPACVTYSMKPYNGVEDQNMVYRSCMLSPDDFCRSHTKFNKDNTCKSCNSTDFCM